MNTGNTQTIKSIKNRVLFDEKLEGYNIKMSNVLSYNLGYLVQRSSFEFLKI